MVKNLKSLRKARRYGNSGEKPLPCPGLVCDFPKRPAQTVRLIEPVYVGLEDKRINPLVDRRADTTRCWVDSGIIRKATGNIGNTGAFMKGRPGVAFKPIVTVR